MTSQQRRRFTLALHAYNRAKQHAASRGTEKATRHYSKATEHLYHVADTLHKVDRRKCTCPGHIDITFIGHLPDCPLS